MCPRLETSKDPGQEVFSGPPAENWAQQQNYVSRYQHSLDHVPLGPDDFSYTGLVMSTAMKMVIETEGPASQFCPPSSP